MEINWQQFGLKANPYDAHPLTEGGEIPLEEAFVGRGHERRAIEDHILSNNNLCLVLGGEAGVGKTSLMNYEKKIWKQSIHEKQLFSARYEIEAHDTLLTKEAFIFEIIASILREIRLTQPDLMKCSILEKLEQVVDVRQHMDISGGASLGVAGVGVSVNTAREKKHTPPIHFAMGMLEQGFLDLLSFVKTHDIRGRRYNGLIVHMNNFDVVLRRAGGKERVRAFFNEIRDLLQTYDTYFFFLGPPTLFVDTIATEQRVKSVFVRTPIIVRPLSKQEVVEAFEKRMHILMSEGVQQYIRPVEDHVIYRLYDLHGGDIRMIMSSLKDILHMCSDKVVQTLSVEQAMVLLGEERWGRVEHHLTKTQQAILQRIVSLEGPVSVSEVAKLTHKQVANVSTYFRVLKEHGVIEEKEQEGKVVRYGLTTEYVPLQWWFSAHNVVVQHRENTIAQQPSLFA